MPSLSIDQEHCSACGRCGAVCPRRVPETVDRGGTKRTVITERVEVCISCGQCMAICPKGAIALEGLDPADLEPTPKIDCTPEQMLSVMRHRRSARRYKDRPVERDVIDQVVEAVRWAPTAGSLARTGVLVVDRPELLREISGHLYALYDKAEKGLANPIGRLVMTWKGGAAQVRTLREHVMPGMRWYRKWRDAGEGDEILRDCPVLMLFHGSVDEPSVDESCVIAAWQAILMAEVLGLGTCFNGLVPPPCNKVPALRERLRMPDDHEVYAALTMGWPKHRYKRTIRRRLQGVRYLD